MKNLITAAAVTLLLVGCSKESPRGGPGAAELDRDRQVRDARSTTATTNPAQDTFQLKIPARDIKVKPGARQEVEISLDRGSAFNQSVTVAAEPAADIRLIPAKSVIAPTQASAKVLVEAKTDAVPGQTSIVLVGTPESGKPTEVRLEVQIVKD